METENPICNVQAKFKSDSGEDTGYPVELPLNINRDQLGIICNAFLEEVNIN